MLRTTVRHGTRLLGLVAVLVMAYVGLHSSAQAASFSNPAAMTIPESGPASMYPAPIVVTGLFGTVSKVTVSLNGLNHEFPRDIDVLLVSPAGTPFVLMADVCGDVATPFVNTSLTFDDAAVVTLPANGAGPCASGTVRPANTGIKSAPEEFPSPAPEGPYFVAAPEGTTTLAVFNGENPNGAWSLYIVDDDAIASGSLAGGWSLTITTAMGSTPGPGMDSTPPELGISVDPTTKDVRVEGVDNTGGSGLATSNPVSPSNCTTQRGTQQVCIYRAADHAGNSVTATLQVTKQSGQTQVVVQRIEYSGRGASTPLSNSLVVNFAPGSGAPVLFNQAASVTEPGPPAISRRVTANWTATGGATTVLQVTPPGPAQSCAGTGPALLVVRTEAGALRIPAVC